jgi:lipid-binding SYLF domain-containing protein
MRCLALCCTTLVACHALAVEVRAADSPGKIVSKSADVLEDMAGVYIKEIPEALLGEAEGVAVIPGLLKAGFIIGGRHGEGLVVVRQEDGTWSQPVFITLSGGSIGWQAGAQKADVVLVFKRRETVLEMLEDRKFTLGADAAIAAGPAGRHAEAGTDGQLEAEIYAYARTRGLFVGLALEGSVVRVNPTHNAAYYESSDIEAEQILAGEVAAVPEPTVALHEQLGRWVPVEVLEASPE